MSTPEKPGFARGKERAKVPGREALRAPLPKRFYKSVTVAAANLPPPLCIRHDGEGGRGYCILLDGKRVKTPKKRELALPDRALAVAVAAEWAAQGERIDPATMPLTRIANTAIDAVADHMGEVAADIAAFAASDLVCYRAAGPEGLVARQAASWDPVLDWAEWELGVGFMLAEGVNPVAQPPQMLARIAAALDGLDPFRLASLHVMTTLTGSALLALACARRRLALQEAWAAAHVDEDWQIEHWGVDAEAKARRRYRLSEFEAAGRMMELLAAN